MGFLGVKKDIHIAHQCNVTQNECASLLLLVVCCAITQASTASREFDIIGAADLQGQLETALRELDLDGVKETPQRSSGMGAF